MLLSIVLLAALAAVPMPGTQRPKPEDPATWGRRTPLGTQVKKKPAEPPEPEAPKERLDQALSRALSAAGGRSAVNAVADSVSTGTLTRFDASGNATSSPVTLTRKGDGKVQRVVKHQGQDMKLGSDGVDTWDTWDGFSVKVGGPSLAFLESQTVRSAKNLWDAEARGLAVRDAGVRKKAGREEFRVVEVEDRDGRKTSYFIDGATSRIIRVEFVTAESRSPFGGAILRDTEAYQYSDFRTVRGVQTPFTIERFLNGRKVEEMRFTTVQHNVSVKDSTFTR
jgi:hypothetical protein